MFKGISFAYPWMLYFLLIIPILAAWYIWQGRKKQAAIKYSSLKIFPQH
jgi:Ca-activated chloride channel family protein